MTGSSLAEALYRAHKDKATGALRMTSGGRESRLLLREGDLVGAQIGFGHRTAVQALLLAGRLDYGSLDGLWARGDAGAPDPETLEHCEVDPAGLRDLQLLANVRSLARAGEGAQLVPGDVADETARVAGALAVRAAFEGAEDPRRHYRCPDVAACAPWIADESDRVFLQRFSSTSPVPEDATASQRALLLLLAREGTVEALTDDEFARGEASRGHAEQAAREAEEARRLEAQAAREAEEARLAQEAQAAREAEEAFRLEQEAQAALASAPPPAPAAEQPLAEADWFAEDAAAEQARMREARARAQAEVQRDLEEALRRSSASPGEAWPADDGVLEASAADILPVEPSAPEPMPAAAAPEPAVLEIPEAEVGPAGDPEMIELSDVDVSLVAAEPSAEAAAAAVPPGWDASLASAPPPQIVADWSEGVAPPQDGQDAQWAVSSPAPAPAPAQAPSAAPQIAAPPAAPGRLEDPDLWRIVTFDTAKEDSLSSSFEEALQRVDAHLEHLVGMEPADAAPPLAANPFPDSSALPEVNIEAAPAAAIPPPAQVPAAGGIPAAPDDTEPTLEELEELFPDDEAELAGDPADPVEAAKLRRQRLLKRAMENMGVLRRPGAAAAPSGTAVEAPAAPSGPATPATPDEAQFARSVETRYEQLQSKPNHFAVLGIGQGASRDQVKAAFLGLAKQFHPDRLPLGLAALAPKINAVFEAIREGYEVLYDDAKRKAYVATLQPARAPGTPAGAAAANPKRAQEAEELFKRGEVYFKKREFKTAEEHFQKAYDADNKASYLAAKAWAIYMDPSRKAEVSMARQLMTEALRIDPGCDRAHYQLGVIARVEGDVDGAERHFRDAVRSNPKHLEANQELRLIDLRKKSTPGKKGLFR